MKYDPNYFGPNNIYCRCRTCQKKKFSPTSDGSSTSTFSMPSPPVITPPLQTTTITEDDTVLPPQTTTILEHDDTVSLPSPPDMAPPSQAELEVLEVLPKPEGRKQTKKNVKTDDRVECLICHSIVNRMDRHIIRHADVLDKKQLKFILDFYRTKNAPKNKKIYDCKKCYRRFASLVTHTNSTKCDPEHIVVVENPQSRSSLPTDIRASIKSQVLPSTKDLELGQRFVQYRTSLAKCSDPDKVWSQDRGGIIQLMAQMFKMTCGLRKPETLVSSCLEIKASRNLKPQTMLNYLSIFQLFVEFCFLMEEVKLPSGEAERMKSAIRDARKAFAPAAAENYRKTAEDMRAKVPSAEIVRQRYRQITTILRNNLDTNELSYRKQQVLNFFLLQGRINTR